MVKIFISYRRVDSQYVTDSIYEHMTRHFGKDNVFLDVGSIPFGVDFRKYLSDQIATHDVVLVIIGSEWAKIMKERAQQENDFVRIEIENALKQDKLVIPVLVMNATMPDFSELPESVKDLQWRNSAVIRRQPDLESDCTRLAGGIRQVIQSVGQATPVTQKPTSLDLMPKPFAWVEIPKKGYSIAKYPVTNAQFAKFMEAGGYKTQKWWTDVGWQQREKNNWTKPRFWTDSKWNGAEQPVVGVSWYEAVAFCLWLSETTGEQIMLPTEDQWQYAAQGDDGRRFPWGDYWDGHLCNNNVNGRGIGSTTPVLQYEGENNRLLGESYFGVVDMAGNTWEWCLTDFDNKTNGITRSASERVLRGGSWTRYREEWFRCETRHGAEPFLGKNTYSFRLALIPLSQ
ncbi:MAG: hypothetical protein OHK0046_31610 [Anaerolineae bacterium]